MVRATDVNELEIRVIAEYPPSLAKNSNAEELLKAQEEVEAQQRAMGLPMPGDEMGTPGMTPMGMTPQPGMMPPGMPGAAPPVEEEGLLEALVPEDLPPEDLQDIDGISPELRRLREWKKRNDIALVLEDVQFEWDVSVNTDTALPTSPAERGQVAADLFRLGAIDRKALLSALNYPDAEGILKRLEGAVTGKDAGNPEAESGQNTVEMLLQNFAGILMELGIPQELLPSIMEGLQGSIQSPGQGAPPQGGNFPPQIAM